MEFWEKFSKTVSEAADYTAREAGKLTGIAKLKYRIATSKARLENLYASLGRLKYDEHKGTAPSGTVTFDELVTKIDNVKAELQRYEDELAKLKNERHCVNCRALIGLDMAYCPRCGAKQPEPEQSDECCCGCNAEDVSECCDGDESECCCGEESGCCDDADKSECCDGKKSECSGTEDKGCGCDDSSCDTEKAEGDGSCCCGKDN